MEPKRTRRLLLYIFLLNIADTIFTWISVNGDAAYEINPTVNLLLSCGPVGFFCVKIGLVSLALLFAYVRIKVDAPRYIYVFTAVVVIMLVIVILGFLGTLLTFL